MLARGEPDGFLDDGPFYGASLKTLRQARIGALADVAARPGRSGSRRRLARIDALIDLTLTDDQVDG